LYVNGNMELPLTNEDKNYLKNLHRSLKDKRKADRIKIVIMLDKRRTFLYSYIYKNYLTQKIFLFPKLQIQFI
jgi:hypothetical protein